MINNINAEKLKVLLSDLKESHKYCKGDFHDGVVFAVNEIEEDMKEIITSLHQEQQEVDLEKEIAIYFQGFWPGMKTPEARNHQLVLTTSAIMELIEYFFKLGLNTRKEE